METIKLKKLAVRNFKGIRDLSIDFEDVTNIFGENGAGKTTVFDAFTFLFFGKDSEGRSQFQIKTLDKNNRVIPKLEHEVTGVIETSGQTIEVKRILKEKWVKKRGALESEFAGNESLFYWNNVPMLAKEYHSKVNELLDEGVFKLITNPLHFNSLKWQDRRETLIRIAGDLTDNEVAMGNEEFIKLIAGLQDKTIEQYRREIASRKKKLNTDLKAIPTRIDEAERSMPEQLDFKAMRIQKSELTDSLKSVEAQLMDKSEALRSAQQKASEKQTKIHQIKTSMQEVEFECKQRLNREENDKRSVYNNIKTNLDNKLQEAVKLEGSIAAKSEKLGLLESRKSRLVQEWEAENAKAFSFDESTCECPTCKRVFESDVIEQKRSELEKNFNIEKSEKLQLLNSTGSSVAEEITSLGTEITLDKSALTKVRDVISELQLKLESEKQVLDGSKSVVTIDVLLSTNSEYQTLQSELKELEESVVESPKVDNTHLLEQKQHLVTEIATLERKLSSEEVIARAKTRITELSKEEENLAQQISELEGTEFTVESFVKSKIEALESRINKKFKFVTFKMFDIQINGAEVECCEALVDGVPFTDLNNAARINAGLDIINTLCEFYNVSAPVFIDNRESVNDLIDSHSQIVNLIVSKDPELKVA